MSITKIAISVKGRVIPFRLPQRSYRLADFIPAGIRQSDSARLRFTVSDWRINVRRLMAARGLDQTQLAAAAKMRPNTLSEALNKRNPRIDTVETIAEGLDVPMWALFLDEREYGLVKNLLQQADADAVESKRREDVKAAVQNELAPMVEAIVAKLTGQSVSLPAEKLPLPKPTLAVQKRKAGRR